MTTEIIQNINEWISVFKILALPIFYCMLSTLSTSVLSILIFCCSVSKSCLTLCDSWTAACQVPLCSTLSWDLLIFMSIESVMLSNHLILCHPLFLVSSIFPSIRVFSNELALRIRWPKYWSFSISLSNEYSGLISFRMTDLISLQSKGLSRVFSSTTVWKHQFFSTQLSLWSNSHTAFKFLVWLMFCQ